MKKLESRTTRIYDEGEHVIGEVTTDIYAPSSLWDRIAGEWQRSPYFVQIYLQDGVTCDSILARARTREIARTEHDRRVGNYKAHLLGWDV